MKTERRGCKIEKRSWIWDLMADHEQLCTGNPDTCPNA